MRARLLLFLMLWAGPAWADPREGWCSSGEWDHVMCIRPAHFVHDTCQALDYFARAHGLNRYFFTRLIWQESRFDPNALSPANAMGIAQFIRSTAKLRGLRDPYNPAEALEHSAEYLGEMQRRYGNMGLAAVGYNGGERRAEGLMQGGGLARETINYVRIITGLTAETWRDTPPDKLDLRLDPGKGFIEACHALARGRRLTKLKITPPEPVLKPWGVQLAWGTTQAKSKAAFRRQTAACRGAVKGERVDYVNVRNRVRTKPAYVMARISRNTRKAADRFCNSLRRAGCTCAVYSNRQ
ncbi:transglycosylase SLT domain-containing protein [Pseudaestuariivita atlantica]|uniref:Transglycosylase n=1 Tax=Pseudaestuariivita atlantica TaxID=1317121 RepID=A0A0L1JV64_9RHOB|nr:transglycosylase SLT domain-containing protein [Pseudaestuariivita atlantica]KNG95582.1 transglycosylase [Pseudaestuariivita atlantica]